MPGLFKQYLADPYGSTEPWPCPGRALWFRAETWAFTLSEAEHLGGWCLGQRSDFQGSPWEEVGRMQD